MLVLLQLLHAIFLLFIYYPQDSTPVVQCGAVVLYCAIGPAAHKAYHLPLSNSVVEPGVYGDVYAGTVLSN